MHRRVLTIGFLIGGGILFPHCFAQSPGTFAPTGSMTNARAAHTATMLQDGRVLIAGGTNGIAGETNGPLIVPLVNAEIYSPATGTFTPTGNMLHARMLHTATLLSDGRVLVKPEATTAEITLTAELQGSSSGTFSETGSLRTARRESTRPLYSTPDRS